MATKQQDRLERLKELGLIIKKTPLQGSDYKFLNPGEVVVETEIELDLERLQTSMESGFIEIPKDATREEVRTIIFGVDKQKSDSEEYHTKRKAELMEKFKKRFPNGAKIDTEEQ